MGSPGAVATLIHSLVFRLHAAQAAAMVAEVVRVGNSAIGHTRICAGAVRAATAQAVHGNYASWYLSLADNASALATSTMGFLDLGSLTPAEKAQFVCTFMAFMSHSQNAFHQWRLGHLARDLWACWEALMMNLVNTPGGAEFWRERSYVFGTEFQDEVRAIMAREPNPAAKAFGVVPVKHTVAPAAGADSAN